ncbi:3-oxoacyl-ACP synthase [Aquimarina sp. RZ0]|uniref:3-oxoacyl-ACP synthase n=1 Tax=Aquimarina sp. RZ0 TaxID=2607730 RepID=UPI0011F1BA7D|nr:3-oxoacyl-ACP synthase [Aquimarina sp. RZ0]KAA1247333.1 3-oxoacyl-ACP synthase [Aquimarina sp. RZ0]
MHTGFNHKIKSELLNQCLSYVNQRQERILDTISDIQESLTSETKSTAGDKHETGRAMLQLEREKAGVQLAEVKKLQEIVNKIDTSPSSAVIRLGSLVETSQERYFLSISIGKLIIGDQTYFAIAANTPIGKLLLGKKVDDRIHFNGKDFKITKIE